MSPENTLPYNLSPEELNEFMDLVESMPRDRDEGDLRDKIGSNYSRIKSAAESLGFSKSYKDNIVLTELGKEFLQSPEDMIAQAIADYEPYARFFRNHDEEEITKSETTNFFMQEFGKGRRASEQASLFLFRLLSDCRVADYQKGHGQRDTRIRLEPRFSDRLNKSLSSKEAYELTISDDYKSKTIEIEDDFDWEVAEAVFKSFKEKWRGNKKI